MSYVPLHEFARATMPAEPKDEQTPTNESPKKIVHSDPEGAQSIVEAMRNSATPRQPRPPRLTAAQLKQLRTVKRPGQR